MRNTFYSFWIYPIEIIWARLSKFWYVFKCFYACQAELGPSKRCVLLGIFCICNQNNRIYIKAETKYITMDLIPEVASGYKTFRTMWRRPSLCRLSYCSFRILCTKLIQGTHYCLKLAYDKGWDWVFFFEHGF